MDAPNTRASNVHNRKVSKRRVSIMVVVGAIDGVVANKHCIFLCIYRTSYSEFMVLPERERKK